MSKLSASILYFAITVLAATGIFFSTQKAYAAENLMPNPSLETVAIGESRPASWFRGGWGTNTANLTYVSDAHTGTQAVRVDMTSYGSGDAKWYAISAPVTGGQVYEYSDFYKSNVTTELGLQIERSNGTYLYTTFTSVPASSSWSQAKATYTMPSDAVRVSIFHIIAAVGFLVTDDYSLMNATIAPPPPTDTFTRGLVSVNFDDGYRSIYTKGFPLFKKYNILTTQYLTSGFLDRDSFYMTNAQVREMQAAGHEVGAHTVDHSDLTTLSDAALEAQLRDSKNYLEQRYGSVPNFASPYGSYDARVLNMIKNYYASHRSVNQGYNSKSNFDPYAIKVQNIYSNTSTSQVQSWLTSAKQNKTWLVLVYHQVDGRGQYSIRSRNLEGHLQAIVASGVPVKTMQQALNELRPQLP